ncbi:MAG: hypothetical protein CM1200mP18_21400 [Gammaproteobacteria bacterium]|nr:MAG: hypothetical protein CM1200mP18_21400 [Gammaproteobacteria bacterium]
MLAELLDQGKVLGWFQGVWNLAPRTGCALDLGDPRNTDMQSVMKLKIKYPGKHFAHSHRVCSRTGGRLFRPNNGKSLHVLGQMYKQSRKIVEPSDEDFSESNN